MKDRKRQLMSKRKIEIKMEQEKERKRFKRQVIGRQVRENLVRE